MKSYLKDLLTLLIVIAVLCVFVYMFDYPAEQKRDIYYGVVGGGVTAFIVVYIIQKLRKPKE